MNSRLALVFALGASIPLVACGSVASAPSQGPDAAADGAAPDGAALLADGSVPVEGGVEGGASGPDATVDAALDAPLDARSGDATLADGSTHAADGSIDAADGGELALISTYLGGLFAFDVDPATGDPSPKDGSPVSLGAHFYSLALHPSRRFVYAVGVEDNEVFGYRLGADGSLTPVPGSPFASDGGPITVSVDPLGRFAYVGNASSKSVAVLRVDADSGALAAVSGSPFAVTTPVAFIAGDLSGRYVYVTEFGGAGIHGFAIDGDSGSLAEMAGSPFARSEVLGGAIAIHPNGTYVYAGELSAFAIDGDSGALAELPGSPLDASIGSDPNAIDLVVDSQGAHAYGIDMATGTVSAFHIDPDSGALAPAPGSPYDAGPAPYSVAVDPEGRFVYVPSDGAGIAVFSVDAPTGALTPIAGSPFPLQASQPEVVVTSASP
jgi:6-phosphogluconolactonase (cycloisomerase 2 family)